MSHALKQKRHRLVTQSDHLAAKGSSLQPLNNSTNHLLVSPVTQTTSISSNTPAAKKRRLSADKTLVVSVVGIENIDIDSMSLGRMKRKI